MGTELHPEAEVILAEAADQPFPPTQALSVESARQRLEDLVADQSVEDVAQVEAFSIPGPETSDEDVPLRAYVPDGDGPHPVLVYYHGGGWTVGSLDTHDNVCAALTNRADCLTVSVDYRLAPEHPFPAALEDAYAAAEWVAEYGDRLGADSGRLAVAGDSAGGNLAAGVTLVARDQGGPEIDYQGLIYPAVASAELHEFDSYAENAEGYLLEQAGMEWYHDKYVDSPAHARNAYLAPLLADDHADLPPATVVTAGFDPLRDEGEAYAEALADDGVAVEHRHYPGMVHGFVSLPDFLSPGAEELDALGEDLRAALHE